MKITRTLLAALIPVITFGAAEEDNFTKVELNSVGKVIITQGDANYVEINSSGSKEDIKTSVRNNTLYIDSKVDAEYKITMRDIEALITSSQRTVTGDVRIRLSKGNIVVEGTKSPHSLLDQKIGTYGESNRAWNGAEAAAFSKIYGLQSALAYKASRNQKSEIRSQK